MMSSFLIICYFEAGLHHPLTFFLEGIYQVSPTALSGSQKSDRLILTKPLPVSLAFSCPFHLYLVRKFSQPSSLSTNSEYCYYWMRQEFNPSSQPSTDGHKPLPSSTATIGKFYSLVVYKTIAKFIGPRESHILSSITMMKM